MNQVTTSSTTYNSNTKGRTKADYPFFSSAIKYGVIAGGLISLSLFILQSLGMQDAVGWKYASYSFLGIILAVGIGDYDRFLKTGTTFRNGMTFGAQISLLTGLTIVAVNTLTFLAGSNLAFSKYGVEAADFPTLLTLDGALFLEIMVAGLVFTLIALQYFKSRDDYSA